jgi:hypothetical protein
MATVSVSFDDGNKVDDVYIAKTSDAWELARILLQTDTVTSVRVIKDAK